MEFLTDKEQETVRELNRQAVSALINQSGPVEEICQQVLRLSAPEGIDRPRDLPGAAEALQTLGRHAMARSDFGAALDRFRAALLLFQRADLVRQTALARSYLGVVFTSLGDYSRAAEILSEAIREAEAIPDDALSAEILNNLSYTYVLAGQPGLALAHLQRSIQVFRSLHDEMRLAWALDSLGQAYLLSKRTEEALACVLEGMDLSVKNQVWRDVARFKQSAGEMYRAAGEPAQALKMFTEALELARKYSMVGDQCSALLSIAEVFQAEGRYAETLPLLREAEYIVAETHVRPHARQCYLLFSRVYRSMEQYRQALEYYERFYEADKEIYNTDADQRLQKVMVLYQLETARKETELYQLRAQTLQQEVEERKQTEAILSRMARTDPLTDLLNRRAFFDLVEKAFAEAVRDCAPLSLILMDIDHFKEVNDYYGHQVGDQVLTQVALRLRGNLRDNDFIARYGGEEFIVLLTGINPAETFHLADRLRQAVSEKEVLTQGLFIKVTLSLGVASLDYSSGPVTLDQLIAQADRAMYSAKSRGRNTVYAYNRLGSDKVF